MLNKVKVNSNMYNWVTHTHTHLGGICPHKCSYCYVNSFRNRTDKYQGNLRLIEKELLVNYGKGKTIFIEHCNDLFAEDVPDEYITKILNHCLKFPDNIYVFQTKNPARYIYGKFSFPENSMFGTTIETNRNIETSAPMPCYRKQAMINLDEPSYKKFITIEPVMEFDVLVLVDWMRSIKPAFVNIGLDSKGTCLSEPSLEEIKDLIYALGYYRIEVRLKNNLKRLGEIK